MLRLIPQGLGVYGAVLLASSINLKWVQIVGLGSHVGSRWIQFKMCKLRAHTIWQQGALQIRLPNGVATGLASC